MLDLLYQDLIFKTVISQKKNSLLQSFPTVLPELFFQKSPVLAIFWRKSAFCRHHPCFIAFLCGNVLAKYRQMAKIGDFGHFSVLQNRRFGDKSPLLAILNSTKRARVINNNILSCNRCSSPTSSAGGLYSPSQFFKSSSRQYLLYVKTCQTRF